MKKLLLAAVVAALLAPTALAQEPAAATNQVWDLIKSQNDKNEDGKVTATEYTRGEARFKRLDRNRDGVLTKDDFGWTERSRRRGGRGGRGGGGGRRGGAPSAGMIIGFMMDANEDDQVTKAEVLAWFKEKDTDGNGALSKDESGEGFRGQMVMRTFDADKNGSVSRDELVKAFDGAANKEGVVKRTRRRGRGERRGRGNRASRPARPRAPQVGAVAPTFTLTYKDGKSKASLESFRGKKPVALIFGSYT